MTLDEVNCRKTEILEEINKSLWKENNGKRMVELYLQKNVDFR